MSEPFLGHISLTVLRYMLDKQFYFGRVIPGFCYFAMIALNGAMLEMPDNQFYVDREIPRVINST